MLHLQPKGTASLELAGTTERGAPSTLHLPLAKAPLARARWYDRGAATAKAEAMELPAWVKAAHGLSAELIVDGRVQQAARVQGALRSVGIGHLEGTHVSLNFFRQFDKKIKIRTYRKGSKTYRDLTSALKIWAENTLLLLAKRTPDDLILPLIKRLPLVQWPHPSLVGQWQSQFQETRNGATP
jgi:hypothetical protein